MKFTEEELKIILTALEGYYEQFVPEDFANQLAAIEKKIQKQMKKWREKNARL